jgi:hypothetical protein
VTAATIQHLEQLLDLLPGTQHLEEVVVEEEFRQQSMLQGCRDVFKTLSEPEARLLFGMLGPTTAGSPEPPPSISTSSSQSAVATQPTFSSHSGGAGSGGGGSWRSSCKALAVMLRQPDWSSPVPLDLDHLQPLLGSLQQPRAIFMAGVSLWGLPECVEGLRPVEALHFHAAHDIDEDAFACMAALTNLRHLGIVCSDNDITTFPVACTDLVHLTSLELCCNRLTQEALEGVCDSTTLEQLHLNDTVGYSTLPDSISKLVGLRVLLMQGTQVSSLPEGMTALTGLRVFTWSCWGTTAALQLEVLWRLKSLGVIFLKDDHMAALPPAVSQLSNLHLLQVESQALAMVPDSLTTMVTLGFLQLKAPRLHMLPEGITALTRLQHLSALGVVLQQQPPAVRSFLGEREAQGCSLQLAPDDSSSE